MVDDHTLPELKPVQKDIDEGIILPPTTYLFVVLPSAKLSVCKWNLVYATEGEKSSRKWVIVWKWDWSIRQSEYIYIFSNCFDYLMTENIYLQLWCLFFRETVIILYIFIFVHTLFSSICNIVFQREFFMSFFCLRCEDT